MASKIILKKSVTPAKVPVVGDLEYGELALNYYDGKLYYKTSSNTISSFSSGVLGGGVIAVSSASYTGVATSGMTILLCDTTANSITVNLPTAVGNTAIYEIKKTAAANSMILDPISTQTIDGSATVTVVVENESLTLVSDGTNWRVI